eukprot:1192946-Prorocentrum_minimum.AAC.12
MHSCKGQLFIGVNVPFASLLEQMWGMCKNLKTNSVEEKTNVIQTDPERLPMTDVPLVIDMPSRPHQCNDCALGLCDG